MEKQISSDIPSWFIPSKYATYFTALETSLEQCYYKNGSGLFISDIEAIIEKVSRKKRLQSISKQYSAIFRNSIFTITHRL